ncbi:hypothetical protein BC941DRAFT_506346 [Chlamydoabsidia padenii]|nr:hypothetical protein BC941DRAFT_506346 [Chlamydoabsidia padenii]
MLFDLPNEILLEVFSYMDLKENVKMGQVCSTWRQQRDVAISRAIGQTKILICSSPKLDKSNTIELTLSSCQDGWVEFKPITSGLLSGKDIQGVRMVFEGWPCTSTIAPSSLSPQQQAHYFFHHTYVALHQQLYLFPELLAKFWAGDQWTACIQIENRKNVVSARVSIPWLLSRSSLVVPDDDNESSDTSALGRYQALHQALVDPSVVYKYHLAKLYLLGNSSLSLDEVVRKIMMSEQEWALVKPDLIKALSSLLE